MWRHIDRNDLLNTLVRDGTMFVNRWEDHGSSILQYQKWWILSFRISSGFGL